MTMPPDNHALGDPVERRLLDRLVDGELAEDERRALLRRLEADPDGWRCCALAFLESQAWREALRPLVRPAQQSPRTAPAMEGRPRGRWRPVAHRAALAASLAAAFTLGWALHRPPPETAPTPLPPATEVATNVDLPRPEPAAQPSPPSAPAGATAALEHVVKQWAQRGYHAELQKRQVSMELHNGRKLKLPVHEVRLRYVGDRTY